MIRCPICMATVRETVAGPVNWRILAQADRAVARATFATQAELADHLVEVHGWSHQPLKAQSEAA